MAELNDVFMPQWALGITEMADGMEMMVLEVSTASVQITVALATKENYRQVADKLSEGIRRLGAEMKTPLITNVKELPDALRNRPPQGG